MATSGTVGQTVIDTATLLDHAFRRCGKLPKDQTPELVDTALECLFMLAVHLANDGLNLWTISKHFIGLTADKATYTLPAGTLSIQNVNYAEVTSTTGTTSSTSTSFTDALDDAARVYRVGVRFTSSPSASFTIDSSSDGASWTTRKTVALADVPSAGSWYWTELDPVVEASYFRINSSAVLTVDEFVLVTAISDIPMYPWNRDDYANQPDKYSSGRRCTNYFFEKLLTPQITFWQRPSTDTDHVVVWVHRQIEDVGTLSQSLAIPTRWYDSFCMQLAFRLALELPDVPPQRLTMLKTLADEFVITSGADETDGAPVFLAPNISRYTR